MDDMRQAMMVAVVELAATWAVQRAMGLAYRKLTGQQEPYRDSAVPLTRILVWAGSTAAAVAITNVLVDRVALRRSGQM